MRTVEHNSSFLPCVSFCRRYTRERERERVKEDNEKERIIREISNDVMES